MRKLCFGFVILLTALDAKAMEGSNTTTPSSITLYEVLKKEKDNRGDFVRKITNDLKQCTNGRMLELKYLPVKASYWWDRYPGEMRFKMVTDKLKPLNIDIKNGSSVYDREIPYTIYSSKKGFQFNDTKNVPINSGLFLNSEKMTREKLSFFYDRQYKDLESDLPKNIQSWVDYRKDIGFDKKLDTYPSVFHMIDVVKRLKSDELPEPTSCPISSKMVQSENPSSVIERHVQKIFSQPYFKDFYSQNHPLTHIIIDHLNKLLVFAQNNRFKASNNPEYKKSVMYDKIMHHIDQIIYLMSAFEIDLTNNISRIKGTEEWDNQLIPQNPYILYVQFYEIINDLLYLLMNLEDMYSLEDFDQIISSSYINRFPVLDNLKKSQDIAIHSYPARSGMEAFVNSVMSMGYVPGSIPVNDKVGGFQNTLYFEIDTLNNEYLNNHKRTDNKQRKWIFMFTKELNETSLKQARESISKEYAADLIQDAIKQPGSGELNIALERFLSIKQTYEQADQAYEALLDADSSDEEVEYDEARYKHEEENLKRLKENYENAEKDFDNKVYEEFFVINKDYINTISQQIQRGERVTAKPVFLDFRGLSPYEKEQIDRKMKQELINFIVSEINKNVDFILPFIKFNNGMGIIILSEALQPQDDNLLFTTTSDGYMRYFDAVPGIQSGMTTDTIDILNDQKKLDQLYTIINSKKFVQKNVFSIKSPFIILWDTTVEVDDGPSYRLIEKFKEEIKSGDVIFILYKSLQKYANLGVGKTKAGAVTVIGKESEYLTQIMNNLKRYSDDVFSKGRKKDYSFMTFLYERVKLPQDRTSKDNELLYYLATKEHAEKIAKSNPRYGISGGCLFISTSQLDNLGLPYSDTFGFAIPTTTNITGTSPIKRISVGLDPKGLEASLYAVPGS